MKIFIGEIPEAFGEGISATGESKAECEKALWNEFKRLKRTYQSLHDITNLSRAFEYFGGGVAEVTVGKAYIGSFNN